MALPRHLWLLAPYRTGDKLLDAAWGCPSMTHYGLRRLMRGWPRADRVRGAFSWRRAFTLSDAPLLDLIETGKRYQADSFSGVSEPE
jgi:hypothetical protein